MFANFTEETCTGTGDTLTATGATTENLEFSLSYADGALVQYSVRDSGGIIKVSGVGVFNTSPNTITRSDTYNYNGTVVDKEPTSNITLSAGAHTVTCSAVSDSFAPSIIGATYNSNNRFFQTGGSSVSSAKGGGEFTASAGRFALEPFFLPYSVVVNIIGCAITQVSAGGNFRCAVYKYNAASPSRAGKLMFESGNKSTAATGFISQTLSTPVRLDRGFYYCAVAVDNTTAEFNGSRKTNFADVNISLNGGDASSTSSGGERMPFINQSFGAFPLDLSAITPNGDTAWGTPLIAYR
jgi:hypothetical protein